MVAHREGRRMTVGNGDKGIQQEEAVWCGGKEPGLWHQTDWIRPSAPPLTSCGSQCLLSFFRSKM